MSISQPILICLFQQLGAVLVTASDVGDIKTILTWLQEIAVTIDPTNPNIQRRKFTHYGCDGNVYDVRVMLSLTDVIFLCVCAHATDRGWGDGATGRGCAHMHGACARVRQSVCN